MLIVTKSDLFAFVEDLAATAEDHAGCYPPDEIEGRNQKVALMRKALLGVIDDQTDVTYTLEVETD